MECEMVVEQLSSQEFRMQYDEKHDRFIQTQYRALGHIRGFVGIYGWLVGFGSPPQPHLDVMAPTTRSYINGDIVKIRVIGCFKRNDGDNKFVAVESDRQEQTLADLPEAELSMLKKIYPRVDEGERWLEREESVAMIQEPGASRRS